MQPHNIVTREQWFEAHLDLTPLGRHEEGLPCQMDRVRLRDAYKAAPVAAACCQT